MEFKEVTVFCSPVQIGAGNPLEIKAVETVDFWYLSRR
jgi:hypothetical protein